jgi:hypothetical protein
MHEKLMAELEHGDAGLDELPREPQGVSAETSFVRSLDDLSRA